MRARLLCTRHENGRALVVKGVQLPYGPNMEADRDRAISLRALWSPVSQPDLLSLGLGGGGGGGLHLAGGEGGARQQRSKHAPVAGGAAFQGHQRRQRLLAVFQVAAHRLAGLAGRPPDPEDVVDHLECNPEVVAELARFFQRGIADAGRQAAQPSGARKERRRLQPHHLHVLVDRDVDPLLELQVEHLTAAEREHRLGQQ